MTSFETFTAAVEERCDVLGITFTYDILARALDTATDLVADGEMDETLRDE
jgi:hypothetical protein